jgi:hypothetical protein
MFAQQAEVSHRAGMLNKYVLQQCNKQQFPQRSCGAVHLREFSAHTQIYIQMRAQSNSNSMIR